MTMNKQIGWSQEAILLHRISKELERLAGIIAASGGGGGGAVTSVTFTGTSGSASLTGGVLNIPNYTANLGYTASPANGIITNTLGTAATLPLVTGTNAGLMSPADQAKLASLTSTLAISLAAPFPSTVITRATVTGWTFPVTAGKRYRIEISATQQTGVTTTGCTIGVILSSGTGTIQGYMDGELTQTAGATGTRTTIFAINAVNTTPGSFLLVTAVNPINAPHYVGGVMTFICTTSGVFEVQYATEIAASAAQLNTGSTLIVKEI